MWSGLKTNRKLALSLGSAVGAGLVIVVLLIDWFSSRATLSALSGSLAGWATGILLAPYPEEEKHFSRISKAIFSFIAGLAVGKIDTLLAWLASPVTTGKDSNGMDLVLGACCFMLATIAVFVSRTYSTI
jgi:hypothetical protein